MRALGPLSYMMVAQAEIGKSGQYPASKSGRGALIYFNKNGRNSSTIVNTIYLCCLLIIYRAAKESDKRVALSYRNSVATKIGNLG